MKNKVIITLLIALFSMFSISFLQLKKIKSVKDENNRLSLNQNALNDTLIQYKSKSGKNAAKISQIVYTKKEIKDYNPELIKTIKDLRLKLKNVESISKIGTNSVDSFKTKLDSIKCFDYNTNYLKFNGCIKNDSIQAFYQTFDTLTIVSNIEKKRVWLLFMKKVGVSLDIISANKNSKIDYAKYIDLR